MSSKPPLPICGRCHMAKECLYIHCYCGQFCGNECMTNHICPFPNGKEGHCALCKCNYAVCNDSKAVTNCDYCQKTFCNKGCKNNHQCPTSLHCCPNVCSCDICNKSCTPIAFFSEYQRACEAVSFSQSCQYCQIKIPLDNSTAVFWYITSTVPFGRATRGHSQNRSVNNGFLCIVCQPMAIYDDSSSPPKKAIGIRSNSTNPFLHVGSSLGPDYSNSFASSDYGNMLIYSLIKGIDINIYHNVVPNRIQPIRKSNHLEHRSYLRIATEQEQLENKLQRYDKSIKITYDNVEHFLRVYFDNRINMAQLMQLLAFPMFEMPPIEMKMMLRHDNKRCDILSTHLMNVHKERCLYLPILDVLQNIVFEYIDCLDYLHKLICSHRLFFPQSIKHPY